MSATAIKLPARLDLGEGDAYLYDADNFVVADFFGHVGCANQTLSALNERPALLADVERMRKRIAELEAVLTPFANAGFAKARAALASKED